MAPFSKSPTRTTPQTREVLPVDLQSPRPHIVSAADEVKTVDEVKTEEEVKAEPAKRRYVKADLSKITLEMATAAPLEETELATVPSEGTEARSDVQKQIDGQFRDAYMAWEAAGKPKTPRECYEHDRAVHAEFRARQEQVPHTRLIVRRFLLDPEQEAAFRVLVRKAAEVDAHSAKILPIASHVSGRHVLIWMPRDLAKRTPKNATATVADPAKKPAE